MQESTQPTTPTTMRIAVAYLDGSDRPLRYRESLDWEGTITRVGSAADSSAETHRCRAEL